LLQDEPVSDAFLCYGFIAGQQQSRSELEFLPSPVVEALIPDAISVT